MASDLSRWTIGELGERATAALLASGYTPPPNGQVRPVPDLRTVRYYMSLGLLDPPLEMRGRTGLYGRRHLYQLVAIKRLQQDGLKLGEIQARLAGLDDRALAQVARVSEQALAAEAKAASPAGGAPRAAAALAPAPAPPPPVAAAAAARADSPRRARAFWAEPPASAVTRPAPGAPPAIATPAASPVWLAKVVLAPGVELLIETRTPLDAGALRRAAAPLMAELGRQTKET